MAMDYDIIPARRHTFLKAIDLAHKVVEIAGDKQAQDVLLLDVRKIASFTDYFVILSGENERHVNALCDEIISTLKKNGVKSYRHEGETGSGWLLIDYGDVIVHIFSTAEREYYQLEKLWDQAKPVIRIQ